MSDKPNLREIIERKRYGKRHKELKEELRKLVEEWRNNPYHPADGGRRMEMCAEDLEELLEEYA